MPISAEIRCPPTKGHGWAMGLCKAANNSTDEAPMEAIMSGTALCPRLEHNMPVRSMATKAASAETIFSVSLTGAEGWASEAMSFLRGMYQSDRFDAR